MKKTCWFLLLITLVVGTLPVRAAKKSKWHELRSEHFHVITDGSTKKAAKITRKLEEFRLLLSLVLPGMRLDPPIPTTVILFKNSKSIRPYQRVDREGRVIKSAGFMQHGQERMYLVVDTAGREYLQTAFHEYIHLVLRLTADSYPVWVDEGIAEFYEQTVIRGRNFKVGFADEGWWSLLRRSRLIPFDTLQRVTRSSEHYNVRKKRQIFYAQSWALVQYLMTGKERARQSQFGQYVSLVSRGVPLDEAFQSAFQQDYKSLQKEFKTYIRRGRYSYYTGKLSARIVVEIGEPVPLPPVVAQAYTADLWINSGRVGEAEHALRELAATGPPTHEVQYRLGRIHMIKREWEEAEKYFQSALDLKSDDLSSRYYAAMSLMIGRQPGQEADDRQAVASQVVELLTPVVERSRDFADAHRMLISARMQRGDDAKEMIPVVEMVRQRNPQETELSFLLVSLYMQEKRWDNVEKVLNQLAQRTLSTAEEHRVREQLNWLQERREWSKRFPQSEESPVSFSGGTATVSRKRRGDRINRMPVEPVPAPAPAAPPKMEFVEGTLTEVACDGEGAVLTVRPKGRKAKLLRVAVRSLERALVLDPTHSGQKLVCGEASTRVAVNYRVQPREPDIAGVVVTIEFNPASL